MAKKAAEDKEQVISYDESKDLMKAARLAGRNDLIDPKGKTIRIEGPGSRAVVDNGAEATGDDGNTASPGAASTTRTQ